MHQHRHAITPVTVILHRSPAIRGVNFAYLHLCFLNCVCRRFSRGDRPVYPHVAGAGATVSRWATRRPAALRGLTRKLRALRAPLIGTPFRLIFASNTLGWLASILSARSNTAQVNCMGTSSSRSGGASDCTLDRYEVRRIAMDRVTSRCSRFKHSGVGIQRSD
jgi:hypothetical protein